MKNGIAKEQTGVDSATVFLSDFITNAAINAGIDENQIEFKCPKKAPTEIGSSKRRKTGKRLCQSGMMPPVNQF